MKTLRIYNYEILNFDTEPMVFSSKGFTKITEPKIIEALQLIEKNQSKYIHPHALDHILKKAKLQPASAIKFLKSLSIIGELTDPPSFQRTIIYHDLEIPGETTKYLEKKYNNKLEIRNIADYIHPNNDEPTLFVFACAKLSPHLLKSTYKKLLATNPNYGATVGFISGVHFHLTEIHIPSIGNPCAFCTLDRIAHYESLRTSQHHWSKIWSFCRSNNLDLPKIEIDELQKSLILGTIISFTNKLTQAPKSKTTQDQVLLSRTINLETGITTEDASVHWPLCQCIGFEQ
ncbi:McbB family protein [Pseudomonas sp. NBRC 111132]|uniref:McbB family protein n=1 Tax=Pseudomonas sp. NBRC 111132 TaxID=1661047 RepID=UPI000760D5D7|nr:McbB family protein [Pseudomonas sp. NBRC 111132]